MQRYVATAALAAGFIAAARDARADDRTVAIVGVGVTSIGDTGYTGTTHALALDVALAYKLGPHFSIGMRLATSTSTSYATTPDYGNLPGDYEQSQYSVIPIDVGVTALFARSGLWIAPWVGEHFSHPSATSNINGPTPSIDTADFPMIGLTAGVDLFADHRDTLGLYIDVCHSVGGPRVTGDTNGSNPEFSGWAALTFGVAYHHY
jgi:hypothetical protein